MTTREEQRDVAKKMVVVNGQSHEIMRPDISDATVASRVRMLMPGQLDHEFVCMLARDRILYLSQELDRLRASQAGGVPAGWRDLIEEIDAELDRQLYDEEYVRQCRNNDLDVPSDCEHHIIIREALRSKIAKAAASPPPPAIDHAGWQDISTAPKDGTYVDIWGVNPAGRRFPGVRWTDWPPVGAVDGFTWRDERGVPVVDHADAVATNWMALPSAPGAPPPATDGALESEGLVQAAVQGNGSVTLPVCQWKQIETAPKDGTWVLGFRPTSFREDQIDTWQFVHRSCDPPIWINSADSNDEDEQPTHWMPLPPRPDDRTNGSEAQSGSLNHALPASLVSATDAVEAERRKFEKARTDIQHLLAIIDFTAEATGEGPDDADAQMVADIRADYGSAAIRARGTEGAVVKDSLTTAADEVAEPQ